ncbi:amino acid ABC transporter permease [Achromobacter denitrificans]|uniref:Amino acid ABC transporter permease n=1 Tax=Achromobacter denitrificans TaxID=32002 RepID=A0ABZ3G678_ACHDE
MFSVLFEEVPEGGERYLDWLMTGLGWTLFLALAGWAIAFALGLAVGCARTARNRPIAALARIYVEVFRNIPVIVQMFVWYFVVPELLPRAWGDAIKAVPPPWGSVIPALLGLALYTAARVAEQVKAGIEALPPGQRQAAEALGMRSLQVYRLVLLPQALRIIIPTLTSEVMGIFKNSSVALTIGVLELTAQARQINEFTFQTFQAFGAATLLYLLLACLVYVCMRVIEGRLRIPGQQAEAAPGGRTRSLMRWRKSLKEV